jgi:hypothetical protein
MANTSSPYSTYSDTTPHKRVIEDYISLIDPYDSPFIDVIGGLDGASSKFNFVNQGKMVEWMEDTLTPLAGTFSIAAATTTATTWTTLVVLDGNAIQPGHILRTENNELLWVSAVSGTTVTVTRAIGTQTGTTISSTGAFTIVGMARLEGDDSDAIGFTTISTNYNYTQIFHQELKQTGTDEYQDRYGMSDAWSYQAAKAIPQQMRLIERTLQYGVRSAGSATTPRMMGGYGTFISSNTMSVASNSMTQGSFESAVKLAYDDGGSGRYTAICSPTNMQRIKNFYDTSSFLRIDRNERTVGMSINGILTPFGTVDLVMDRWQPDSLIPIIDLNNIGMLTLRPWFWEDLAKGGDARKAELIGEFTLCVRQNQSHATLAVTG